MATVVVLNKKRLFLVYSAYGQLIFFSWIFVMNNCTLTILVLKPGIAVELPQLKINPEKIFDFTNEVKDNRFSQNC